MLGPDPNGPWEGGKSGHRSPLPTLTRDTHPRDGDTAGVTPKAPAGAGPCSRDLVGAQESPARPRSSASLPQHRLGRLGQERPRADPGASPSDTHASAALEATSCEQGCSEPVRDKRSPLGTTGAPDTNQTVPHAGHGAVSSRGSCCCLRRTGRPGRDRNAQRSGPGLSSPA